MEVSDYIINVLSAIIAIEYMDYGFEKKYHGVKRSLFFIGGCVAYFLVVTVLNCLISFEGVLGFTYGLVVVSYALLALKGTWQDFLLAGLLWILIALIGTYGIWGVMGLITEKRLDMMLQMEEGLQIYASLVALIVKYSLGKIVSIFFRKEEGFYKRENGIVAWAFVLMVFLALAMFYLELGNMSVKQKYELTIIILLDEIGIVATLIGLYHKLGIYQKDKMQEQYMRKREEDRQQELKDLYLIGREINHWRHDILGALSVLYRMQKKGNYGEVESYMEKIYSELKDYPELPQPTGNEGVDAALIKMIAKCKENDIHFSYVVLGKMQKIEGIVLGNLMDNLLSNGLESCMRQTGIKEIEIVLRDLGNGLEIQQENSIDESVLENNPDLRSYKKHRERHGFGMENIFRTVEEYDGMYENWEEENRFCQRIYLKYKDAV